MEINLAYNLKDKVYIIPLNVEGTITAVTITCDGVEIKCKYYMSGESKYDWFWEEELDLIKEKSVGFE